MVDKNRIPAYLQNLALLMQESAEHGEMDSSAYVDTLELMGALAAALGEEVAA